MGAFPRRIDEHLLEHHQRDRRDGHDHEQGGDQEYDSIALRLLPPRALGGELRVEES